MPRPARLLEIRRPQKIAALLLSLFLLQCLYVVSTRPLDENEVRTAFAARRFWLRTPLNSAGRWQPDFDESIFAIRAAGILPAIKQKLALGEAQGRIYAAPSRWLTRLPFVAFGLWLGAALWWVARRLYGNRGGYIALALFCFSPLMVLYSSTIHSDIFVAWGTFGLIFTAIGVAHTLYAPARRWRTRILILGAAIGFLAAANLLAALIAMLFALVFILYLAPGRRLAGIGVLALSSLVGAIIFWFCYGFRGGVFEKVRLSLTVDTDLVIRWASHPSSWVFVAAFALCILIYIAWPHTRYFGNSAPLIVSCILFLILPGAYLNGSGNMLKMPLWALPFACVFIGGIFADLLEDHFLRGRYRRYVIMLVATVLICNAVLSLLAVYQGPRPWFNF